MKRTINIITSAIFLALIFGFGVTFWIVPDSAFSEEENRALQTFPTVTTDGWLDGTVSGKLTDYFSDQFPMRSDFVRLCAFAELGRGAKESNGVLLGANGQLAVRRFDMYISRTERADDTDFYRIEHVQKGMDALVRLDQTLSEAGIPLCVVAAPRTIDVAAEDFAYPAILSDRLDSILQDGLSEINSVELLETFRTMHNAGEYVYLRTDHHWNSLGAYTAYTAVMASWGMENEVLPAEFYTVRPISDFYGTTHSRAGMGFIEPDTLEIWEATDGSDAHYTVLDAGGAAVIESGFIKEERLAEKDKYGAFLDGTHRLLTITKKETSDSSPRPRLLLARDSFANSMVPFLARHFDIVMVNLSGGMTNLSALAEEYDCDRVLIICNRENFITSDCIMLVE